MGPYILAFRLPHRKICYESFGEQEDQLINVSLARHESLWQRNCLTEHCQCSCGVLNGVRFTWSVGLFKSEFWLCCCLLKQSQLQQAPSFPKTGLIFYLIFGQWIFCWGGYLNTKVHEIPPTRIPGLKHWIQQCLEGILNDFLQQVMTYVIHKSFINRYPSTYLCVYYILQNK